MTSRFTHFAATALIAVGIFGVQTAEAMPGAIVTVNGPSAIVIDGSPLNPFGDVFPSPGTSLHVAQQGLVVVTGTGSLQMTSDTTLSLTEFGIICFEGGSSSVNDGTFSHNGFGMELSGSSSLTNNGNYTQTSGTALVGAGSTFDGAGGAIIDGGTMTVDGLMIKTGVTLNGGSLQGSGTVRANVANLGGTVGPGNSPGTLTVDGNYTQGAGGTLEIEIGSLLSFDILDVLGSAALDGILDLTVDAGYAAAAQNGDSFTIIEWDSFSGAFATVSGLTFGDGKFFTLDYGATGLTLTVNAGTVVAASEPVTIALFGLGLAGLGFARRKRAA